MNRCFVALFSLSISICAFAQQQPNPAEKMKNASFLVGEWKGEGWTMTRSGKSESITHETVTFKAGGTVLMIEGVGTDKATGKEIHNAFGILRFDEVAKGYKLTSYLSTGMSGEFDVTIKDGTLVWEIKGERQVRYTMKIDEKGRWHEIGEVKLAEDKWMQFMEMTLSRV